LKITFVLQEMGVGAVGGIRVVYEYANRLSDKGHQVTIVYPLTPYVPRLKGSSPKDQLRWLKGQTRWLIQNLKRRKNVGWFGVKARIKVIPTNSPAFSGFSQRWIPDADVVLATAWETAYLVSKLGSKKGKKFYFIQHYEIWPVWNDDSSWQKAEAIESDPNKLCLAMHDVTPDNPKLKAFKDLVDASYKLPLNKIVISTWLKQLIEEKFGEPARGPIPNGVNFQTFFLENTLHMGNRVLMPWRPAKWKGTQHGLNAYSQAHQQFPDVEFALHGVRAQNDLPDWIVKHGRVSDDELRHLYNQSDIYVIPSWVEGSQLPPMEAMACGCAVVATNVGGVTDYAVAGKTVLVSPPRKPEALAANLIELLGNKEKLKDMAKAGNEYIAQFTWEKATNSLEEILKSTL
jgi:glycosyltransferase involved in cell wall biosynthesis